jgi:hypothetical protein
MISLPKASNNQEADISNIALETYKNQIKAEQKLEELTKKIEALSTSGNVSQSMIQHQISKLLSRPDEFSFLYLVSFSPR